MADWNYDQARRVARWPLRELLLAFLERIRDRAMEAYRWDVLTWAVLEPHRKEESRGKPPKVPDILKKG